ncbi:meiotic nuclear division protein 1 homolog [Tribolium castaneum]|uniref:Meiotic nuclear division protein 1 homolog n=1 Tax=Tribolium castaneum TaxID=7070 RepID=D6WWC7_TRICA|nr:PREDICTED: meiotic nuclear division protein 1 homolog isoform X1 [Tribolium castaneum]EFA08150.1 Meiotic nuclear division protein 1 homolog-like Protein [Tribolium castaneum]|eukprot:XP_973081.1 PREDICTED: meiotic nuclear division protein 1 homolog isoform X1 [Tribolium castaneum]
MFKKKGLSFEEKKARMLQLFHETGDFYQMNELEIIAPKEKGITANSVKEVVQALVDDGSVDKDKIGSSVYFWAFPSKLLNAKKRKLNELQTKLESSTKKLKLIDETMEKAQVGKENWDDSQILKEIEKLEKQKEKFESLSKSHTDTQNLKLMQSEIKPVKEAANRWTDNIFAVKSWCKRKFMMEDKVLNKQFGIPGDLDYLA